MKNKGIWIALTIVVVLIFMGVGSYNSFVTQEENVTNKMSQVDNQLKRRSDLIPNLVNTVKGYATQEKDVIASVTDARAKLAGAQTTADKSKADAELSGALSRLLVVVENYPDLKSNQNFQALMDSLEGTENRLAIARKDYNDAVTVYNQKIKKFPGVLVAGPFGFEKKDYFEVSEKDQATPEVDFSGDGNK
ncbi:LemA family protein [Bacillus sp. AFS055030]|uniref:LemA family protein n=1 Tax=Bacillus sp. AFS055030 TaxID=2033507 RepID=UPI000BFC4600|nr:LemA family protein [Bacillus sp. AFS055030]PGL69113.1 LemA family protein [Bacillus sp. AFS055030]